MGNILQKLLGFLFLLTLVVIFFGRLFGVWEGDPLIPLGIIILITTNAAIYQLSLTTLGGMVQWTKLNQAPPPNLQKQIERQAEQN